MVCGQAGELTVQRVGIRVGGMWMISADRNQGMAVHRAIRRPRLAGDVNRQEWPSSRGDWVIHIC